MEKDIYRAPESNVEVPVQIVGSSIKGIIYGSLIAFPGSLLVGFIFGIIYAIVQSNSGASPEEIKASLTSLHFTSAPGALVIMLIIPIVFLGGYVCARKSIKKIYRNVTIVCIAGLVLGYLMDDRPDYTLADSIIGYSASIIPAYLGAYFWQKKSS